MKFKSDSQRRAIFAKMGSRFSASALSAKQIKDCNSFSLVPRDDKRDLIEEQKMLIFKLNKPPLGFTREEQRAIVQRLDVIDKQLRDKEMLSRSAGDGFANAIVGLWPDRDTIHTGASGNKIADAVVGMWPDAPAQEVDEFGNVIRRRSFGDSMSDAITGLWPG